MGFKKRVIRPVYEDKFEDDDLEDVLVQKLDDEKDEMSKLSFGSLNSAQKQLENDSDSGSGGSSDSDSGPEVSSSSHVQKPEKKRFLKEDHKRRSKHAPSESSSKRPVSKIRAIPGLEPKSQSLYGDIRFDATYGKADLIKIRKNYEFLDEYRKDEINKMEAILKDKPQKYLSEFQQNDLKNQIQTLKSRLNTMQNRDLEHKILSEHKQAQLSNFKSGKQANPYFLKQSEKKKLIQKARFDSMKSGQREKAMERKRKKRLGKEFKQLEFRQT